MFKSTVGFFNMYREWRSLYKRPGPKDNVTYLVSYGTV